MKRQLHELDYLTTEEAAAYCRVSLSQFKKHAPALALRPFRFMGKVVYRKADLKSVLEGAWLKSGAGAEPGFSTGEMRPGDDTVIRLDKFLQPPRALPSPNTAYEL